VVVVVGVTVVAGVGGNWNVMLPVTLVELQHPSPDWLPENVPLTVAPETVAVPVAVPLHGSPNVSV
jgi:hypothetical protein